MPNSAKVHMEGPDQKVVESGGVITVKSGGSIAVEAGGTINLAAGALLKAAGTQAAHIADASVAHALNSTFSDTEAEAALNALGAKINSILDAMEGAGILAAS